jgi:MFS family permease
MRVSHTIRTLITSDFLINAGFSVFAPVFAVFVTKQITDGTIQVVGFAAAIAQLVKATLQIPVAHWLDKNHGEYDDFYSMVIGSCIVASSPFLYLFASHAWHIYAIQAWFGVGTALSVPPWYAIFTRHIDKMRENVEWSLESVAIGISGAASAALSGIIVAQFGFRWAFFAGGVFAVLGAIMQIRIYHDLRSVAKHGEVRAQPDKVEDVP